MHQYFSSFPADPNVQPCLRTSAAESKGGFLHFRFGFVLARRENIITLRRMLIFFTCFHIQVISADDLPEFQIFVLGVGLKVWVTGKI